MAEVDRSSREVDRFPNKVDVDRFSTVVDLKLGRDPWELISSRTKLNFLNTARRLQAKTVLRIPAEESLTSRPRSAKG
eukprot:2298786-Amphidinium_carterae.1